MIPTREQINAYPYFGDTSQTWLRAMRDEIDNLQKVYELTHDRWLARRAESNKMRRAIIAIGTDVGASVNEACSTEFLCEVAGEVKSVVTKLRAELDRANAALAKATTDNRAKIQSELRSIERTLCSADVLNKFAALSRGTYECHVKNTIETAISALRDDAATTPYSPPFEGNPKDCAFKTTPAPEREAAIRAWEESALDAPEHGNQNANPLDTFIVYRKEITAAVALMRSAGDGKALLRELREWICDEWATHVGGGDIRRILDGIDELLALPAPVEQPAAAVTDHVPDAGKMVPVLYWLEDGKFARAMLVGKDLLVVDLTFGDGPSVVGKPEWFDAGYVATYGGLVPESATQGKEPGQWDYGVASIAKPAAAVPDDCGLGQITAEMVQAGIAAVKDGRWITLEQLRKELAPVPDDPRWELVAQLGHFVCMMLKGEANRAEVRDIISKLRGGA